MRVRYLLFFILLFYLWIASGGKNNLGFDLPYGGSWYVSYNHLMEGFLNGKLHFLVEPRPELLALDDPYEPSQNMPYRWHDASLYKGKYYMYFGITPLLVLYLPFHLLTNMNMPDKLASTIFMFGSLLWCTLILLHIKNTYFRAVPKWLVLISVLVLGLSIPTPFIVREDNGVYHVAISSGLFFLTGAIYFFCRMFSKKNYSIWIPITGSLFLGLAVGARPQIILSSILLPFILFKLARSENKSVLKIHTVLALILPLFLCLAFLGVYNYLRFDNPFEFGLKYQVGLLNYMKTKFNYAEYIIPGIFTFIFRPPAINSSFPCIHIDPTSLPSFVKPPTSFPLEPMMGILPSVPFVLIMFVGLTVWFFQICLNRFKCSDVCFDEFIIILLPALISLGVLISLPFGAFRYLADFSMIFILATCIICFYFYEQMLNHGFLSKLFNSLIVILAMVSIVNGVAIGLETLKKYDVKEYKFMESLFNQFLESVSCSPEKN